MSLYFCFPLDVPKTFTEPFEIWDHCENVIFLCVPLEVNVIVPLLVTELEVYFCLELVETQSG